MTNEKARRHYRFDNFKRAYFLLQEAAERHQDGQSSQLAKEGMIQRFEVSYMKNCPGSVDVLKLRVVAFAKTGVQPTFMPSSYQKTLDSRVRGNDGS